MPTLEIDGCEVRAAPGATILDGARELGISIPTLCHRDDLPPNTSCMVCAVSVQRSGRLVPACATPVAEGMVVSTRSEMVLANRRMVLELLLSHHTGDCEAPCQLACPAHLHAPVMLRAIQSGNWRLAEETARESLVLPQTLGHICPAPCERACRRRAHDAGVAIRDLHRSAASRAGPVDPGVVSPMIGPAAPSVAVVGAGPAGLAAAWVLTHSGVDVVVFDDHELVGGMARYGVSRDRLPGVALDADVSRLAGAGVAFRPSSAIRDRQDMARLRGNHAAVVIAAGTDAGIDDFGLRMAKAGVWVERETGATSEPGVFAAGGVIREIRKMAVRAVASGKVAAAGVLDFLGKDGHSRTPDLNVSMGRLRDGEMARFLGAASDAPRSAPSEGPVDPDAAQAESGRCLHCDCRAADDCKLREYAALSGASATRWREERPDFEQDLSHPEIIYESGKCIACGLCIQISKRHGEALGNTFLGRGVDVRIGAPLGEPLSSALTGSAMACVEACPTGALASRET